MKGRCIYIVILTCISLISHAGSSVMADEEPPLFQSDGLVNGYFAFNGIRPYNGTIFEAGALGASNRWGDIASVDGWPLGGFGVSLIGCRIKLLPLESGFGMLGYHPQPEEYPMEKENGPPPGLEKQPQDEGEYLFVDKRLNKSSPYR